MNPIPYGKQHITEEDIQAVVAILKSDYLTQGPTVKEFEEAFAKYIGARFAVAVANGTAALHLNALVLGVQSGHKVITTPITFAASANCIRYCGGEVVFADIAPETYLLDIDAVRNLLKKSPIGTYKGIIPVDFAGRPVNLAAFRELADEYGLWIIEDACHAPGAFYLDNNGHKQQSGNGYFADLAIFSFHPVKHIATGEGGMITTNNETLYKALLTLRTHGITKDPLAFTNDLSFALGDEKADGLDWPGWYMEMQSLGYNFRITDLQAALGISQLKRATQGLEIRRSLADRYNNAFQGKTFIKGQSGSIDGHAYHLYILEVENRLGLYNHLRDKKIFTQIHYIPTHLMPYYRQFGWKEGDLPHAEAYYQRCISLPMYPTLSSDEQDYVIDSVLKFYESK